jgi:hypothetical protein
VSRCLQDCGEALGTVVARDQAVPQHYHPLGMRGDVRLVGDHDDRLTFRGKPLEHPHDFFRGGRVEVTGRLVGQEYRWPVDESARNRNALTLSAGKLVGTVMDSVSELNALERFGCAPLPLV